jgi:hypothetical protein
MNAKYLNPGKVTGIPGMNWYTRVTPTSGADLAVGDFLDSIDHRGCRPIHHIDDSADGRTRRVWFSEFEGDSEMVCVGDVYDVVDPTSHVDPDGTPVGYAPIEDETSPDAERGAR